MKYEVVPQLTRSNQDHQHGKEQGISVHLPIEREDDQCQQYTQQGCRKDHVGQLRDEESVMTFVCFPCVLLIPGAVYPSISVFRSGLMWHAGSAGSYPQINGFMSHFL